MNHNVHLTGVEKIAPESITDFPGSIITSFACQLKTILIFIFLRRYYRMISDLPHYHYCLHLTFCLCLYPIFPHAH